MNESLPIGDEAIHDAAIHDAAIYVGLDYHQDSVQVCVLDRAGKVLANRSVDNHWQRVAEAANRHGTVVRAGVEACCGSADLADELAVKAGWAVDLAHAGFVARMKNSPDKSDHSDARVLADLERVGYVPKVWLAPQHVRELRRVFRLRQQLVEQRRAAKLRVRAVLREQRVKAPGGLSPWSKPWLAWLEGDAGGPLSAAGAFAATRHLRLLAYLEQEVRAVEEELGRMTEGDAAVAALLALPGVGRVTAWALRAEVGSFARFRSGKQLARYCGLSPCNASSGHRRADAGLVRAGNPQLKAVLVEAAQRLVRYEDRWAQLGAKLRANGKCGSVAAAAVANRWVRWLFHRMKGVC